MSQKAISYTFPLLSRKLSSLDSSKLTKRFITSANHLSLDANLVATNVDLVLEHLKARHVNDKLLEDVSKIPELRAKKNILIVAGDAARNTRKTISKDIGKLMAKGEKEQAELLKVKVEDANILAAKADEELSQIEQNIDTIMSMVPNLLDAR